MTILIPSRAGPSMNITMTITKAIATKTTQAMAMTITTIPTAEATTQIIPTVVMEGDTEEGEPITVAPAASINT